MATKTANALAHFSLSAPNAPAAREEMSTETFDAMMSEGLAQAKAGQGFPLDEVFNLLHGDMHG